MSTGETPYDQCPAFLNLRNPAWKAPATSAGEVTCREQSTSVTLSPAGTEVLWGFLWPLLLRGLGAWLCIPPDKAVLRLVLARNACLEL